MTITELYPGMGLAVGDTGLYWNPDDGIVSGREALVEMFDDDLGFASMSCPRSIFAYDALADVL